MAGGATLGNLLYYIKAKNREFKQKMDQSKRKVKDFDGQVQKSKKKLQDWTKTARKVGAVATVAFAGIVTAGKYFVDAASDAEELRNVIEVSFGDMTDSIEQWAEDTASAMSRSNYQIRNFVGTSMAMVKSMVDTEEEAAEMSKTITQLSVDLASFRNISDQRAFEAITGAITGEAEALKRLGYNIQDTAVKDYAMRQGLEKSYESMSLAEKTTLRYQLILERLSDVQGDAIRTSGEYENQTKALKGEIRNLREELGDYLLPTANKIVGVFRDIVGFINDLPKPVKELAAQGTILAAIITGIVGPLGLIVGFLPQIATGLSMVSGAFAPFLVGGGIVLGLASIVGAIFAIRKETRLLTADVEKLTEKELENRKATLESKKARLEELIARGGESNSILGDRLSNDLTERRLANINKNLEETDRQLNKIKSTQDDLKEPIIPVIKPPDIEFKQSQKDLDNTYHSTIAEWEQAEIERIVNRIEEWRKEKEEFERHQNEMDEIYDDRIAEWEQAQINRIVNQVAEWKREKDEFERRQKDLDDIYNSAIEDWEQREIDRIVNRIEEWKKEKEGFAKHQEELDAIYNSKISDWEQAEIDRIANRMAEWRKEQDKIAEKSGFENWLIDLGTQAELAADIFDTMNQGLVDGLTDAIMKGEDFLDVLSNIADQIAAMIVQRGIAQPFVDFLFTSLFPAAHSGAVVTTAGLVQDLPAYHGGGKIPGLAGNEQLIKVIPGERILSPGQNKAFESGEYGKTEVEVNVINETGVPVQTKQETRVDGARTIVDLFLQGYARNISGIQDIVKR